MFRDNARLGTGQTQGQTTPGMRRSLVVGWGTVLTVVGLVEQTTGETIRQEEGWASWEYGYKGLPHLCPLEDEAVIHVNKYFHLQLFRISGKKA
jgi:hypothetical protein